VACGPPGPAGGRRSEPDATSRLKPGPPAQSRVTGPPGRQMSISSLYGSSSRCALVLSSKERGSAVTSAWWKCTFVTVHCQELKTSLKFRVQTFTCNLLPVFGLQVLQSLGSSCGPDVHDVTTLNPPFKLLISTSSHVHRDVTGRCSDRPA
jgi:hypothetical protein